MSRFTLFFLTSLSLVCLSSCARRPPVARLTPPVPAPAVDQDRDASPMDALHDYLMRRLPEGATTLDPELFRAAQRQIGAMPRIRASAGPAAGGLNWTPVGPGNIGGRTRSFLINPLDPNTVWVGAVTGGVWKTTDGGQNWNLLTDPSANVTVGSMVF